MAGGPAQTHIAVGDFRYRLIATERDGRWLARAGRGPAGDPFGIECGGTTEAEAVHRLARWLAWQHEHAAALAALQETEHAYHRTLVGSAFAVPGEGTTNIDRQAALDVVDAARQRLDGIRASQPETS
jgi:hypothetical protein